MEQGSFEWLEFRKTRIGASDAPVIMGVSKWKTPIELWKEKVGLAEAPPKNRAMQRGNEKESDAREVYSLIKGEIFFPTVETSAFYPWMIASMDGMSSNKKKAVEIKCPGEKDHATAVNGHIPEHYYPQLQHQMYVCDLNEIDYFSYDGWQNVIVPVLRDDDYILQLIQKQIEFYNCMTTMTQPYLSEKDYVQRNDAEWECTANQWLEVHSRLNTLAKEEEELRKKLITLSNGQNSQGSGISLSHCQRQGTINYASIPELSHIDLNQYRKGPTTYQKISFKGEKRVEFP